MATNTFTAISKTTVGTAATSVTLNLPSGYDHLYLVTTIKASTSGTGLTYQFNGDNGVGSLYSNTGFRANGTLAQSFRQTNNTEGILSNVADAPTTYPGTYIAHLLNYSSSNYKQVLIRSTSGNGTEMFTTTYRQTSAITSMKIMISSGTISVGSTFTVYGIKAEAPLPKATGGTIYADGQYYYHVFNATSTFTPTQALTCDTLIVAGGGGGGARVGGGGGAGGYRLLTGVSATATPYTITVGAGGNGEQYSGGTGTNGGNSTALGNSASGGGWGGSYSGGANNGHTGGSGGGANGNGTATGAAGNSGGYTPIEGYTGGNSTFVASNGAGGGGGGAGGNGGNGIASLAGNGGVGIAVPAGWSAATGIGYRGYIAGGGGGGTETGCMWGFGGIGGGGTGSNSSAAATNGLIYTGSGGGGGGCCSTNQNGGNGGSGIVIVRYLK